MVFSAAVPMNLFAAPAANRLTRQVAESVAGQLFVDPATYTGKTVEVDVATELRTPVNPDNPTEKDPVRHLTTSRGPALEIELDKTNDSEMQAIRLTLTNARWAFWTAMAGTNLTGATGTLPSSFDASKFTVAALPVGIINIQTAAAAALAGGGTGFTAPVADAASTTEEKFLYYTDPTGKDEDYVLYQQSADELIVFFIPNNGEIRNIPLAMMALNDNAITVNINSASSAVKNETLTLSYSGSGTINTIKEQRTGTKEVLLDDIVFTERVLDSIKANTNSDVESSRSFLKIKVPYGYKLEPITGYTGADAGKNGQFLVNGNIFTGLTYAVENGDQSVLVIEITDTAEAAFSALLSSVVTNKITLKNFVLKPVKAGDVDFDVDIPVTVESNTIGITNGTIEKAAKFLDFGVYYNLADKEKVPTIKAGQRNETVAKVVLSEKIVNSWWTNKKTTFELVDEDGKLRTDVKISSVIVALENFDATVPKKGFEFFNVWKDTDAKKKNENSVAFNDNGWSNAEDFVTFSKYGNVFYLEANDATKTKPAVATITLKLSFDSSCEGGVYLQAKNSSFGIDYEAIENNGVVQIAEVEKQFNIATGTTEVQIGAQRYNVKNVSIEELDVRAFLPDGDIILSLGEFGSAGLVATGGLKFVPLEAGDQIVISGGDRTFSLEDIEVSTVATNFIEVTVENTSKTNPVTLSFEKLQAYVDRTVPNGVYELIISGSAFKENIDVSSNYKLVNGWIVNDMFSEVAFIAEGYITVATEQNNVAYRNEVRIMDGVVAALVNGEAVDLPRHPEFNSDQNRFYVPLTGIAQLLGTSRYYWDNDQRVATVLFNDRSVQFKIGSSQFWIAGEAFARPMDAAAYLRFDENGGGYTYIPFAALGEAFDIPTSFIVEDDGTIVGIYNEKK